MARALIASVIMLAVVAMACRSKLDSRVAVYDSIMLRGAEENRCEVVDEALEYLTSTEVYQAEGAKWTARLDEIEEEHSGLIRRVQAMQEEIETGAYPHLVTRKLWEAGRQDCVESGLLEVK